MRRALAHKFAAGRNPLGGHDELAEVLQPPQSHADSRAHDQAKYKGRERRARAAEVERRIKEAEAFADQLRKQLDDLRRRKDGSREAILAGKVPPPLHTAPPMQVAKAAAASAAPLVRGSLIAENKRVQADKAAKAAGVGQDRL